MPTNCLNKSEFNPGFGLGNYVIFMSHSTHVQQLIIPQRISAPIKYEGLWVDVGDTLLQDQAPKVQVRPHGTVMDFGAREN